MVKKRWLEQDPGHGYSKPGSGATPARRMSAAHPPDAPVRSGPHIEPPVADYHHGAPQAPPSSPDRSVGSRSPEPPTPAATTTHGSVAQHPRSRVPYLRPPTSPPVSPGRPHRPRLPPDAHTRTTTSRHRIHPSTRSILNNLRRTSQPALQCRRGNSTEPPARVCGIRPCRASVYTWLLLNPSSVATRSPADTPAGRTPPTTHSSSNSRRPLRWHARPQPSDLLPPQLLHLVNRRAQKVGHRHRQSRDQSLARPSRPCTHALPVRLAYPAPTAPWSDQKSSATPDTHLACAPRSPRAPVPESHSDPFHKNIHLCIIFIYEYSRQEWYRRISGRVHWIYSSMHRA